MHQCDWLNACLAAYLGLFQGFGGTGETDHISGQQGEMANILGEMGAKHLIFFELGYTAKIKNIFSELGRSFHFQEAKTPPWEGLLSLF